MSCAVETGFRVLWSSVTFEKNCRTKLRKKYKYSIENLARCEIATQNGLVMLDRSLSRSQARLCAISLIFPRPVRVQKEPAEFFDLCSPGPLSPKVNLNSTSEELSKLRSFSETAVIALGELQLMRTNKSPSRRKRTN